MNVVIQKFKQVFFSVLPIIILVLILNLTISPIDPLYFIRFLLGSFFVILGLTLFLLGVDIGITPLGDLTGTAFARSNRLWIVLIAGIILGFFISIAEPGLMVLANQVDLVTTGQISRISILVLVSIGLAIMLSLGFLRIFYNIPLYKILIVIYIIIFGLAIFSSREMLAIAFDASGSTSGILAVPFILSLSVGISKLKKDSRASEKDSFGLVAISCTGAILSILFLNLFAKTNEFSGVLEIGSSDANSIFNPFFVVIPKFFQESIFAILPLLIILLVLQKISFRLKRRELRKLLTGFLFAFIGLFVFLMGVNAGFMDVGISIGKNLSLLENKAYIIIVAFVLGFVTMVAEPAVSVLTYQIEEVTSGYIKRMVILIPLATGVGFAVALSIVRILIPEVQLWHYLLPGYILCLLLMFFVPKLFVGIAFDAGGVATGPITATFILAFTQGAAHAYEKADLMVDGFGMIAMVAMSSILTLETLGLLFVYKSKTKGTENRND